MNFRPTTPPRYTVIIDNDSALFATNCPLCAKELKATMDGDTASRRRFDGMATELIANHIMADECPHRATATVHNQNDADPKTVTWIWATNGTLWCQDGDERYENSEVSEVPAKDIQLVRNQITWATKQIKEHTDLRDMLERWLATKA